MLISGAKIVIEQLIEHGVDIVFGYPGGSVLPLYDELYKNSDRIKHVLSAHEQGATHAADGYARVSNKTGVVIATSGPGATNLVTGIANAYLDSVPLVAITGNVSIPMLGKDSFQEVDIVGITQPVVKHNFMVRDISKLENILDQAFFIANSGRKGPVLVDIPKNVQESLYEYRGLSSKQEARNENFDLFSAVEAIKNCKRPYIYAGGGVVAAGAENELFVLSERLNAPVGLSMMGLTALPSSYPLNLGMCGMHGKYAATVAQSECDLVLALGVRFSDRATGNVNEYKESRTIIHIDIDISEMGKNVASHIDVVGDVKAVLTALLPYLPELKNEEWLARIEELKDFDRPKKDNRFTPKNIIMAANAFFASDTVVATDVGQHQMWTMQYYGFTKPKTLLTSGGLGTMGYGLGAAIGGSIALNKKRTLLFTSDGSFSMNLIELATAVTEKLPIVIIILNNGVLGMVRQWQTMFYFERYSNTTLERKTDFVAVAKAFGAEGFSVKDLVELKTAFLKLPNDKPCVIECKIDKDEKVLPMIPPGKSVKNIIIR